MYGAIIGDVCGSMYEFDNHKTDRPETIDLCDPRCYYTDDSVLTCAVAEAAFGDRNYETAILKWARDYPREGYGRHFRKWFASANPAPYNSFGNGSAMRVSAVGWAFPTLEETRAEAQRSACCTHNHPEGIKGAEAAASAIFLARNGETKDAIKAYIESEFGYHLNRTLAEIRPAYQFDESCQGTVPEAIIAFLESRDFTHAIQCAISIGGDSDTIAAVTGGIAEAFYCKKGRSSFPQGLFHFARKKLTLEMQNTLDKIYFGFLRERVAKTLSIHGVQPKGKFL
jgi:ADP-ribosylglycohydrolase